MNLEISRPIFEKYSKIKFRENPSSGSRVVPCGQTDIRTDMAKLIVAFRNFANASNSTQAIGPEPDNRTSSKGTSTDELL